MNTLLILLLGMSVIGLIACIIGYTKLTDPYGKGFAYGVAHGYWFMVVIIVTWLIMELI
jgi:hypothetical protein